MLETKRKTAKDKNAALVLQMYLAHTMRGCTIAMFSQFAYLHFSSAVVVCLHLLLFRFGSHFDICAGIRTPEQQRAWREKMGLLGIILLLMGGVGFLTFGFTQTVCGKPPNRFQTGTIGNGSVIVHGYDYDFTHFHHPAVGNFNGQDNPLLQGNWGIAGNDISFMFQNVGGHCKGLITAANNSSIPMKSGDLEWYFPCNVFSQFGTSGVNLTNYDSNTTCHVSSTARQGLAAMQPQGQVYYTWDNVKASNRNLAVFES